MPRDRDQKGRFVKQNPPTAHSSTGLTTCVAGRPTIEELYEKQRSGQRLTLVERQILLALEVKKNQSPKEPPSVWKQKDIRKPTIEQLEQHVLEEIKVVEEIQSQPIETLQVFEHKMAEEGEGSTRLNMTPKQRLEYERK